MELYIIFRKKLLHLLPYTGFSICNSKLDAFASHAQTTFLHNSLDILFPYTVREIDKTINTVTCTQLI